MEPLPQPSPEAPRTALVHDWLTGMRGGERCLQVLCGLLPRADLFTLFHARGKVDRDLEARGPRTSFLQRLPGVGRYYRYLLPAFPLAVEGFDLSGYARVVSVSHCVAKGVVPPPDSRHICYCLTPMRYVWDAYPLYFENERGHRLPRGPVRVLAHYLRLWDVAASRRVDEFVAVSRFVAERIRKYYGRRAEVIHPPVDWDGFRPVPAPARDFYLVVAADAPYKRLDLVLDAFSRLRRNVKIVGRVPPLTRGGGGRPPAGVERLGWVRDEELRDLYANCRALVFPGAEDFGMAPVEAQAAGRPVIAFGRGGVLESVRGLRVADARAGRQDPWDGYTGVFFEEPSGRALADAVACFETLEERFDPEAVRQWARRFRRSRFEARWKRLLAAADRAQR